MSVWDSIKANQNNETPKPSDGEYFTIHYSTEKHRVRCAAGMTLQRALLENAVRLGYDQSRAVTWRDGDGVVSASMDGQPNRSYIASVSLETKGV